MRIGVFGGSFDPFHCGHLLLAECCAEQGRLDRVLFVPAAAQPLKPTGPAASAEHRLAMVRAAIADEPRFEASTVEIEREGPSYTVDTLAAIAAGRPHDELFFLMGADALADFARWREPARICELATPLVVGRAGEPVVDVGALTPYVAAERLATLKAVQVEMPPVPVSSTEIRRRVAADQPWRDLVPPAVADYINEHGLYRA